MQKKLEGFSPGTILTGAFILSALPLVIVEIFSAQLKFVMEPASYLVFHNIAECFSIMVSLSMFGVGWFTYDQSKNQHALFLGTAFLAIGLIDFMHTMSMPAMPDFVSANLPNKSVEYWISARLLQAIAFLASAYVYPEKPSRRLSKKVLLFLALLVSFVVFTGTTFFPNRVPTFFIVGVGVTPLKKFFEYLIMCLLGAAAIAYWCRMARTGDRLLIYYLAAFVICIFSELVLAFYTRMFDTYNVLGHIYKVAAFSLIYYGIFKASVEGPYIRVTEVSQKLREEIGERKQAEEALREARNHLEVRVEERTAELAQRNEQLRQAEEKSRLLIEHAPSMLYEIDFHRLAFTRVNDAMCQVLGYTREELLAMSPVDLLDDEGKALFRDRIGRKLAGEAIPDSVEYTSRTKDGRKIYGILNVSFTYKDGKPEGAVVVAHDITERKRLEEQIKSMNVELEERVRERTQEVLNERQRLYDVLETLPAMVCLLTPDYHVAFANRSFREKFGESGGRHCYECCFGRTEPCDFCESYKVLKTGNPHSWEIRAPDGISVFDAYDFPFTDVDGSPLILEMDIDITGWKHAEEALRTAQRYNRSLIEASLDPLVTISRNGKIMDVNSATELATGLPRNSLIGGDFSYYFTDPEKARKGYEEVFSKGSVRDYALAIRHTSGRVTEVLYNATTYKNEAGEVQGIFAAARDITERKQAEEALRKSEERLRLLSAQLLAAQEKERRLVAREIHDALGASLAATKYKIEATLAQVADTHPQVVEGLRSIIPVIQGTIDESRRIQMALRPSILDDLGILATIGWFCRQYESTYSAIRVKQEINIEEHEVPDSLKTVIFRVLQEAMHNIAKHSKANEVILSLEKNSGTVQLVVRDNGQGFAVRDILYRKASSRGLGLDSMRERTELAGGSFRIESTASGTLIQASWPLSSQGRISQ